LIGRRVLVISAALVAVALLAWLLLDRDDDGVDAGAPQASSAGRLRALSASVGHDVFWAGPPSRGEALELTHQDNGRIYVRYLSGDGKVGDDRAGFTTVGTYPVPGALAALRREARGPEAVTRDLPEGGFAYLGIDRPTSVYLAWPRSDYEVEVYDPSPKHALDLVLAGKIQPVR
jgi:hypothetical protein